MDKLHALGLVPNMDLETSEEELRLTLQQLRNTILSAKINYGLKYRSDICWCGELIKQPTKHYASRYEEELDVIENSSQADYFTLLGDYRNGLDR